MKKFLLVLLILLVGFGGLVLFKNLNKGIPKLDIEEEVSNIDLITIYGTHLNIHGSLVNEKNLDLVLYNGEFKSYELQASDGAFTLSNHINDGIYLEDFPVGTYYLFLRSTGKDEKDKDVYKYYALNNTTDYKETTYYTFSNANNKIVISSDDEYNTLVLTVNENTDDNIYDVVIDPGHGGMDSGANKNGYSETDFTMDIAMKIKERLESYGVRVKLTREEGQLTKNEVLSDYGKGGRAVISHEVNAKYLFSIHLNSNGSTSIHGVEIYAPVNIDYQFAKTLAANIVEKTGTSYSNNRVSRVFDGIYSRTFTEYDVKTSLEEYANKNMEAYDITTKSNYYYMIRETGGIMTGAYVDNRNEPKIKANPYYNSNVGTEAYLCELGYLTNTTDLENIKNNEDKYVEAIADSFMTLFNVNYTNEG